jgi:hypothetical protein
MMAIEMRLKMYRSWYLFAVWWCKEVLWMDAMSVDALGGPDVGGCGVDRGFVMMRRSLKRKMVRSWRWVFVLDRSGTCCALNSRMKRRCGRATF